MRIKNILSIAAFSTAFVASTAFAGLFIAKSEIPLVLVAEPSRNSRPTSCFKYRNGGSTAEKISAFIRQDIANGAERNRGLLAIDGRYVAPISSSSFDEYSAVTSRYADRSGAMKDDGMPHEFQTAWRAHMKAWRDYADFLESMNDASVRADLGKEYFEILDRSYDREISRTWYEVLQIADEHGSSVR